LNGLYDLWIENFRLCPVLILPADNLDFVAQAADLNLITGQIAARLGLTAEMSP
jgi:deoxyadenosine/deoxycytidine kinase